MFSAGAGAMSCSKINATHIIFESATFNLGSSTVDRETFAVEIFKQVDKANNLTKS